MRILTLHLKGKWFDQVKAGVKTHEYRVVSPYWIKRLRNREYDFIIVCRGYPKGNDFKNRIIFQWNGAKETIIEHEEWGGKRRRVFDIPLIK